MKTVHAVGTAVSVSEAAAERFAGGAERSALRCEVAPSVPGSCPESALIRVAGYFYVPAAMARFFGFITPQREHVPFTQSWRDTHPCGSRFSVGRLFGEVSFGILPEEDFMDALNE